jgi:hypothetical protein
MANTAIWIAMVKRQFVWLVLKYLNVTCSLAKEAAAYRKAFRGFDSAPVNTNAIEALRTAIETEKENLVLLSLGFHSNIAAVMDSIKKNKVQNTISSKLTC